MEKRIETNWSRMILLLAAALFASPGCGGTTDDEGTVDPAVEAMSAAITSSGIAQIVVPKPVRSGFIMEDPTLDPAKSLAENLVAMCNEAKTSTMSCPNAIQCTANSVTGTFTNCKIHEATASGTVEVSLSGGSGMPLTAKFLLKTDFTIDGSTIKAGSTMTETTADGTSFTTGVDLILSDGTRVTFSGKMVADAALRTMVANGTGTLQQPGAPYPTTYTLKDLHHAFGTCYADSGTITQTKMTDVTGPKGRKTTVSVSTTATFDKCTPATGKVMITVTSGGKLTPGTLVPLKAYGMCPSGAACQ